MCLFMGGAHPTFAQGTAFTYQGRLDTDGMPASGTYDLAFSVFDSASAGIQIGDSLTNTAVAVSNGLFVATLDFGAGVFDGSQRWLEIAVSTNGANAFGTLSPRQEITPAPYAIFAGSAITVAAGSVASDQLSTPADPLDGQLLSFSGGSLAWVDPAVASGAIWSKLGSTAYYNAGSVGIGTSAPGPGFLLDVNGEVALRPGGSGGGLVAFATPNAETGMTISSGSGRADLRFDGSTVKLLAGIAGFSPSALGGIAISTNGSVGLGLIPNSGTGVRLQVNGGALLTPGGSGGQIQFGTPNAETGMTITGANRADVRFNGSTLKLLAGTGVGAVPGENGITVSTSGNVGVGNTAPGDRLVVGGNLLADTKIEVNAGGDTYAALRLKNAAGSWLWQVTPSADSPGGRLRLTDESTGHEWVSITHGGNFSVATLTIRGGADVAEPFELSRSDIAKGSVVVIDEDHSGQLKLSDRPYDTRVAGIVSGANGINPGIALHQEGVNDSGQNVALSGRVYVQADAAFGAIKPGDLLTTSRTPGHAMKVTDHAKAQGAILGKAMSSLQQGRGMVLVLVTLQ